MAALATAIRSFTAAAEAIAAAQQRVHAASLAAAAALFGRLERLRCLSGAPVCCRRNSGTHCTTEYCPCYHATARCSTVHRNVDVSQLRAVAVPAGWQQRSACGSRIGSRKPCKTLWCTEQ